MLATFFDQSARVDVSLRAVFRGHAEKAIAEHGPALLLAQLRPHEILGRIGCRGDADQRMHSHGPGERRQQHDPAADAGPNQHLWASRKLVQHRDRVSFPAPDRGVLEGAGRGAVSEIVEAKEGLAALGTETIESLRLGARHIRHEAAQEHHAGRAAGAPSIGDGLAALARQDLGRCRIRMCRTHGHWRCHHRILKQ